MLGSRGVPPANPQIAALSMLSDLIDAVKSSGKTLPAAIAELRASEAASKAAQGELEKARAEHDVRHGELDARSAAADALAADLKRREEDASAKEEETALKMAEFEAHREALVASALELADRQKHVDKLFVDAQDDVRRGQSYIEHEKAAADNAISLSWAEARSAIDLERKNADADIAARRDNAETDMQDAWGRLNLAKSEFEARQKAAHEQARLLRVALGND